MTIPRDREAMAMEILNRLHDIDNLHDEARYLAQALDEHAREACLRVNSDTHKDLYWQAGKIDSLRREVATAHASGYAEGVRDAGKKVEYCNCEITLDQDGVDHILSHIAENIKALLPTGVKDV